MGISKAISGVASSFGQSMPQSGLAGKPRRGTVSRQYKSESASVWPQKLPKITHKKV